MPITKLTLEQQIEQVGIHFRTAKEAKANQLLADLLTELEPTLTKLPANQLERVNQYLPVLLDAQERRDNLFVADILEYEIKPLLKLS